MPVRGRRAAAGPRPGDGDPQEKKSPAKAPGTGVRAAQG